MKPAEFKKIRENLGLTQKDLSEIFGLSSYIPINHYESGFRNPSILIMALMRIFDEWPEKDSLNLREELKSFVLKEQKRKKKES